MQYIWDSGEWPSAWTQSLIICIHKKGSIKNVDRYRTTILVSHMSKIMLKVVLRRLQPIVEELMSEERAGFLAERRTN